MADTNIEISVQSLHVLSAIVVVGYYALLPMWRSAVARSTDAGAWKTFFDASRSLQERAVLPALGLLLVTGLALVFLPPPNNLVDFRSSRNWVLGVTAITVILGVLLYSLSGPAKKMRALVEAGEGTGPAMDKLWGEWRTSLLSGAVLGIVAVVLMVYQGSL